MPKLRNVARLLLPPIVTDMGRHLKALLGRKEADAPPVFEAVLDKDIEQNAANWSHPSIADTQQKKWPLFLTSVEGPRPLGWPHEAPLSASGLPTNLGTHNNIITFAYVIGRAATGKRSVSVLDWGGGVGHYFVYARRLHPELSLDYVVKDQGDLCQVGRQLLPEVTFVSDDGDALARRYDLVFASSSLQYTPNLYALLPRLCDSALEWFMVTRMPFIDEHEDFFVMQRPHRAGYATELPLRVVNRHKFIGVVERQGFELDREFMLADRIAVAKAPEQCVFRGYLFRRRKAPGA